MQGTAPGGSAQPPRGMHVVFPGWPPVERQPRPICCHVWPMCPWLLTILDAHCARHTIGRRPPTRLHQVAAARMGTITPLPASVGNCGGRPRHMCGWRCVHSTHQVSQCPQRILHIHGVLQQHLSTRAPANAPTPRLHPGQAAPHAYASDAAIRPSITPGHVCPVP